jgi:polysaccharide export outer membrane protein
LIKKWTDAVTIRISPVTGAKQPHTRHPKATALLVFAVALSVSPASASLRAQGPVAQSDSSTSPPATPAAATPPAPQSSEYRISPEDVLDVYVFDVPELSREYTVNASGAVIVPLLPEPVPAVGLTLEQFERSLEETFRRTGRLSRPEITVSIKQSRRSVVTVEGAVKNPQAVPVIGRTTLLSVLTQCGGRAVDAGNTITITRGRLALHELAEEGAPAAITAVVEFKNLMDPTNSTSQFDVWPGDRVSVEHAGLFYILGQVVRPGGYNLKSSDEQVSVLQALALAGDTTPLAKIDKTLLLRKNPKAPNGREQIPLNIKNIVNGTSPDRILQADDILYIPVSAGKRARCTRQRSSPQRSSQLPAALCSTLGCRPSELSHA